MECASEYSQQTAAQTVTGDDYYRSNPKLLWFNDEQGAIVYLRKDRTTHVLNPVATLLLLLCDGTSDSETIFSTANSVSVGFSGHAHSSASHDIWFQQAITDQLIIKKSGLVKPPKPIPPKKLKKIADNLLEDGDFGATKRCAEAILKKLPENADAWYLLGDAEHGLENYTAAKVAYEKYQNLSPDNKTIAHLIRALSNEEPPSKAPLDYVKQTFDEYADTFDQSLVHDLEYKAPELIVDALKAHLPKPDRQLHIADLGCGTGLMGKAIGPWAKTICGIDLSTQMLSKALLTEMYNEIHVADISAWLSANTQTYDLLLAADVFEYFGALEEVFKLAKQHVKSTAKFAFTVEISKKQGFELTVSGRYAHHPDYVAEAAQRAGFLLDSISEETIRLEYLKDVKGLVVVLRPS